MEKYYIIEWKEPNEENWSEYFRTTVKYWNQCIAEDVVNHLKHSFELERAAWDVPQFRIKEIKIRYIGE